MNTNPELRGSVADRLAFGEVITSPRGIMAYSHMKSEAGLEKPEAMEHFTGADVEYCKYMFNDVVTRSGTVMSYDDRNGVRRTSDICWYSGAQFGSVLRKAIFVELVDDNGIPTIDVIETSNYSKHDPIFSAEKHPTPESENLQTGQLLEEGTELNRFNSQLNGEFADGINFNVAVMSDPDVTEDAYKITQSAADALMSYGHKYFADDVNSRMYLLNTLGTWDNPKFFPEYGEAIPDTGLVYAMREYDPMFSALDMSVADLMRFNAYFDKGRFADADPEHIGKGPNESPETGSRIVDFQVLRNEAKIKTMRDGTEVNRISAASSNKEVLDMASKPYREFCRRIVEFYLYQVKIHYNKINLTPLASTVIDEALCSVGHMYEQEMRELQNRGYLRLADKVKVTALERDYQYSRISDYRIRMTVRYPIPCTVSTKITDLSGTKGVVGKVIPDHEAPVDPVTGVRVDVIRGADAAPRRSSFSGMYHLHFSAAGHQLWLKLNGKMENEYGVTIQDNPDEAWEVLMEYYARINPEWAEALRITHPTTAKRQELYAEIEKVGVRTWIPLDLEGTPYGKYQELDEFKPEKHKLMITNGFGERELTEMEFAVGKIYMIRLDKTGREFSSTASPRFNYLGLVSAGQDSLRDSMPVNDTAKRYEGESERRLFMGFDKRFASVITSRNNDPKAARIIAEGHRTCEHPSAMGDVTGLGFRVLRESNAQMLIRHPMQCEGYDFYKEPIDKD